MRPDRICLLFRGQELFALADSPKRGFLYKRVPLRELAPETLVAKLKELAGSKSAEAVLVVPREELLSQEFDLETAGTPVKQALYRKLERSFPYRIEEIAYGVRTDAQETAGRVRGVFLAATRQKLDAWIAPVERAGFRVTDAVPSDEALAAYAVSKGARDDKVLVLEAGDHGIECVLVEKGRVRLSRVLPPDTPDALREIGLLTLDGDGFERILVAGGPAAFETALRAQFQTPVDRIEPEPAGRGGGPPAALSGALLTESVKFSSLLPAERKARRKANDERLALLRAGAGMLACLAAACALFFAHARALEWRASSAEARLAELRPQAAELERMHALVLDSARRGEHNTRVLTVLTGLSRRMPAGTALVELRFTEDAMTLRGEGPENRSASEALDAVKGLDGIRDAKLEFVRSKGAEASRLFEFGIRAEVQE